MELFVVNRHEGNESKTSIITENDESTKLKKVLKKIERNKKLRIRQKEKEQNIKFAKQKTIHSRQIKRELKSKIIKVPDNTNDNFIDKSCIQSTDADEKHEDPEKYLKLDSKVLEGFTILGSENNVHKNTVKRVLPNWLTTPTVISVNLQDLKTKVSDIKQLDKGIRKILKANGIKYFFPVQATVISYLLGVLKQSEVMFPRDICVSAPTGSGKTLAYVLPVIQALKQCSIKKIRALVIVPTQDLAIQVYKTFRIYSQNTNIDVCLITGNNSFVVEQSQLIVENTAFGYISKVDILVCTAGRLVDHMKLTKGFDLSNLEYLIIDEADRVLDTIQNDWLYHLEKHISQNDYQQAGKILNLSTLKSRRIPQKLLFSATLSQDPEKLQKLSLFQPKLFTSIVESVVGESDSCEIFNRRNTFIGKYTTPTELIQKYIVTSLDLKPLYLFKFIEMEKITKSLVFTHSVESVHRLTVLLRALFEDNKKVEELSSNLQGKSRSQLIDKFSAGEIDVLVCTDALARGVDLPNVECVISYSAPKYLKTYIHRAGRTARAGSSGSAVTLISKQQETKFKSMLSHINLSNLEQVTISEDELEPLIEQYQQSLQELKRIMHKEEKLDLKKKLSIKGVKHLNKKRKQQQ